MKKKSSHFSLRKKSCGDNKAPMAYASPEALMKSRELVGDSSWLSRKMVNDGCTLGQTLHVMEERCKSCDVISPMLCVEQCETWKVKNELRKINRVLSEDDHTLKLLNAIKNRRRLAILDILESPLSIVDLQKKLRNLGFSHSQKTIGEYLKPLLNAGLIKQTGKRFGFTLYGRKIQDAVVRHGFVGQLPIHSEGYEERILRNLLSDAKTRSELLKIAPVKSLSRTLKRLLERKLIVDNSPSDRVFYFRTKRPLHLERLSQAQKRICDAIPQTGISARDLSRVVGTGMRRVYKYLRSLRGKKLVFRRLVPVRYELTVRGRFVAEFLKEIVDIK